MKKITKSVLRASLTHIYTEMLSQYGCDSQGRLSLAQEEFDEGIDRIWEYIHGRKSEENIENLSMKNDYEKLFKKNLKNLSGHISELDEQKIFDSNEFIRRVPRLLSDLKHYLFEGANNPKDMKEYQGMYENLAKIENTWWERHYLSAFFNGTKIRDFTKKIARSYDLQEPMEEKTLTYIILENFLNLFHFTRVKIDFENSDEKIDIDEFLKEEDKELECIRMLFLGSVLNDSLLNYSLKSLKKELHRMKFQNHSK